MNGQRDEKDILSTPKRKKHHIDYTHINKNEQKELGERRITSCWTQAAFGGRQNGFVYPQRRHSVRSHMSNAVVSIVQVCTGSTWWKRTQSIKNKFSFVNTKPSLNQNEVETSHRPAQSWVKSSRTIQRLGLGGDKIICLPPKAASTTKTTWAKIRQVGYLRKWLSMNIMLLQLGRVEKGQIWKIRRWLPSTIS